MRRATRRIPTAARAEMESGARRLSRDRRAPRPPRPAPLRDRPEERRPDQPAGDEPADHAGGPAIPPRGPAAVRRICPQRADGRGPAARAPVRGQGGRFPVRHAPRSASATVSRDELEAAIESEDGHVHGPGCGHDHGAKPKKAAAKKAGQPRRKLLRPRRLRPTSRRRRRLRRSPPRRRPDRGRVRAELVEALFFCLGRRRPSTGSGRTGRGSQDGQSTTAADRGPPSLLQ